MNQPIIETKPQAIIKRPWHGGAKTPGQMKERLDYFMRKGRVPLVRSERYQNITVPYEDLGKLTKEWALLSGDYQEGQSKAESKKDLTTHIINSYPPGTDPDKAKAASYEWAEDIFGSGDLGDVFDYLHCFHTDREHPHLHVTVNRRGLKGLLLKISQRHPFMNVLYFRRRAVEAAYSQGIILDATSRAERGITVRAINDVEYRHMARDRGLEKPAPDLKTKNGTADAAGGGGQPAGSLPPQDNAPPTSLKPNQQAAKSMPTVKHPQTRVRGPQHKVRKTKQTRKQQRDLASHETQLRNADEQKTRAQETPISTDDNTSQPSQPSNQKPVNKIERDMRNNRRDQTR